MKSLEIRLPEKEIQFLRALTKKGERKAREIYRANILLLATQGMKDTQIANILSLHRQTVWRIKKSYLAEGLDVALKDQPRSGQPKKYTLQHETEIAALACTEPPEGRKRWSLVLLQEELQKREGLETINRESIRRILKKMRPNPGKNGCGAFNK